MIINKDYSYHEVKYKKYKLLNLITNIRYIYIWVLIRMERQTSNWKNTYNNYNKLLLSVIGENIQLIDMKKTGTWNGNRAKFTDFTKK